jgi:hypothetical protein
MGCAWLAALLLPASGAWADTVSVIVNGTQVGTLTATSTNTNNATSASATITANFTTAGQQAGGQQLLNQVAPLGLTYMQTVTFNSQLQQLLFYPSDKTANNSFVLPNGTPFSDPPYQGYVLYDGTTQFNTDTTPWYSTIAPAGTPGALPPTYNWGTAANPNNQQMFDQPNVPWANPPAASNFFGVPALNGLANLLNGANGNISFETALVGSCNTPANPLTGIWNVCVLEDFTWGMNFNYIANSGGSAGNYTNANYTETIQAINFSNMVSTGFQGAFDRLGNNAPVEWNVNFTQASNCVPEPSGFVLLLGGMLALLWYRRRSMTRLAVEIQPRINTNEHE